MALEVGVEQTLNIGERSPGGPAWVKAKHDVFYSKNVIATQVGPLRTVNWVDAGQPRELQVEWRLAGGAEHLEYIDLGIAGPGSGSYSTTYNGLPATCYYHQNWTSLLFKGQSFYGFNATELCVVAYDFWFYYDPDWQWSASVYGDPYLVMTQAQIDSAVFPLISGSYTQGTNYFTASFPNGTFYKSESGLILTLRSWHGCGDLDFVNYIHAIGNHTFEVREAQSLFSSNEKGPLLGTFTVPGNLAITSIS